MGDYAIQDIVMPNYQGQFHTLWTHAKKESGAHRNFIRKDKQ